MPRPLPLVLLVLLAATTAVFAQPPAAVAGPDGTGAAALAPGVRLTWRSAPVVAAPAAATDANAPASAAVPGIVFDVAFDPEQQGPRVGAGGEANGYLGLGLSETGSMKGADIWLLHQDENGAWHLGDYHATDFVTPQLDKSQDLTLLSAERAPNGTVTASFRRALRPCDAGGPAGGDDIAIEPGVPLYMIWARGAWRGAPAYHGPANRGSQLIVLVPDNATATSSTPTAPTAASSTPLTPATSPSGTTTTTAGGGVATDGAPPPPTAAAPVLPSAPRRRRHRLLLRALRQQPPLPAAVAPATPFPSAPAAAATPAGAASPANGPTPAAEPAATAPAANGAAAPMPKAYPQGHGGITGADPGRDNAIAAAATAEAAASPEAGRRVVNLTLPALVVPSNASTTYLTAYFQLPTDRPYWLVRSGPLFNSPRVHHVVVYGCVSDATAAIANLTAAAGPGPYDEFVYPLLCHSIIVLTTPNIRPLAFPPGMGLKLPAWVALEVHYNNPDLSSDSLDPGSGAWLELADRGIQTDIGLFTLGQYDLYIPPGRREVVAPPAICPSACTKRFRTPVTLLYQGFHMHGTGKRAITRRWRAGRELSPMHVQSAWDYGFQSLLPVAQSKSALLPGDRLEFTCVFDSRDRTNTTTWGFGTKFCSTYGNGTTPGNATLIAACAPDSTAAEALASAAQKPKDNAAADKLRSFEAKGWVIAIPPDETEAIAAAAPYRPPPCAAAVAPAATGSGGGAATSLGNGDA